MSKRKMVAHLPHERIRLQFTPDGLRGALTALRLEREEAERQQAKGLGNTMLEKHLNGIIGRALRLDRILATGELEMTADDLRSLLYATLYPTVRIPWEHQTVLVKARAEIRLMLSQEGVVS